MRLSVLGIIAGYEKGVSTSAEYGQKLNEVTEKILFCNGVNGKCQVNNEGRLLIWNTMRSWIFLHRVG